MLEWLMVGATLLSPFFAVQATIALGKRKEKHDRKLHVFHTLLLTRGTGMLAPEHVRSLNMIDIEFHGDRKAKQILSAWRAYRDHLHLPRVQSDVEGAVWSASRTDRLVALLSAMAKYFKSDFDEAFIRNVSYMPQLYGDLEDQTMETRKLLLEVLRGERPVPILPILSPAPPVSSVPEQLKQQSVDQLKQQLDDPKK
jgi:hypothetical protein